MALGVPGVGDLPTLEKGDNKPGHIPTAEQQASSARGARVPRRSLRPLYEGSSTAHKCSSTLSVRSLFTTGHQGALGGRRRCGVGNLGPQRPVHRKGCSCRNSLHSVRLA